MFGSLQDPDRPPAKEIPDVGQLRLGVILFIISLGVLFAASMVGYVIVRMSPIAAAQGPIEVPRSLAVSTVILLIAGYALQRAQKLARSIEFEQAERWLTVTAVFTVGFLVVQTPAMMRLVITHQIAMRDQVGYYGMTFSLIALHAIHVLGGLVPLTFYIVRSVRSGINSTHVRGIRLCALYWHFLEGVWIAMYATFLLVK